MSKTASFRLNDDLAAKLDHLAALLDRPRAWVIEQAIARYVAEETPEVTAIAVALASYRNGTAGLIPHAEVMRELDAMIQAGTSDAARLA